MPWKSFLRMFLQDPRVRDKLSESWPIRRAAQKSVYWYLKGQEKAQEMGVNKTSLSRFTETFKKELKDGMKNLSEGPKQNTSTPPQKSAHNSGVNYGAQNSGQNSAQYRTQNSRQYNASYGAQNSATSGAQYSRQNTASSRRHTGTQNRRGHKH